jgi:alpha-galactosidase
VERLDDDTFLLVKDLADGSKAVGLCNAGYEAAPVVASWGRLGLSGAQPIRDVWRHTNLGRFQGEFRAEVKRRGVVLVRVGETRAP